MITTLLVANVPTIAHESRLTSFIRVRPLPAGLGTLLEPTSPIAILFRKVHDEDKGIAVRLSMALHTRIAMEVIVDESAMSQFGGVAEAAFAVKMMLVTAGFGNAIVPVALSAQVSELENPELK